MYSKSENGYRILVIVKKPFRVFAPLPPSISHWASRSFSLFIFVSCPSVKQHAKRRGRPRKAFPNIFFVHTLYIGMQDIVQMLVDRMLRIEGNLHHVRKGFHVEKRWAVLGRLNPSDPVPFIDGIVDQAQRFSGFEMVLLDQRPHLCLSVLLGGALLARNIGFSLVTTLDSLPNLGRYALVSLTLVIIIAMSFESSLLSRLNAFAHYGYYFPNL